MSKETPPSILFKRFRGRQSKDPGFFIDYLRKEEALPSYEDKPPKSEVFFEHWKTLPEEKKNKILTDLRDADELASYDGGIQAVLAEARFHNEEARVVNAIKDFPDSHAFMAWLLYEIPSIIKKAFKFAYSDKLNLKSWHRLPGFPREKPEDTPDIENALGEALSAFFNETEGRGEKRHVEILDRDGVIYYFVWLEDFARQQPGFEGKKFNPGRIRKDAYEIIYRFDPKAGALETYAQGVARKHRKKLIDMFAKHCLRNAPVPEEENGKPVYTITKLLIEKLHLPTDLGAGIQRCRVKSLRFMVPNNHDFIQVESKDAASDARDFWERFRTNDGTGELLPPVQGSQLIRAEIEIEFVREDADSKPRIKSFSLTRNHCSLRHQPEDDVIRNYLAANGLVENGTD